MGGYGRTKSCNETSLSSLHHDKPDDEEPKEEESSPGGNIVVGSCRLLLKDTSHDHDYIEDQE